MANSKAVNIIYKILTPAQWQAFQENGCFQGSQADQKDGFIHTSFADQYSTTIKKFFEGVRPLILVKPKLPTYMGSMTAA